MRKTTTLLLLLCSLYSFAQTRKYSTFYEQRASHFEQLPISPDDIVFVGNSITNGGEWHEIFDSKNVKNRGISGDTAEGVYDRLDAIIEGQPQKIFLMIGINDIARNTPTDSIVFYIEKTLLKTKETSPNTEIYLQSPLPVNPDFGMFSGHMKPDAILSLNKGIENLAKAYNITYINLYPHFVVEGTTKMKPEYTNDGLHLLGEGYQKWRDIISPYIQNKKQSDMINNTTHTSLPNYPIIGGVSAPFAGIHNNALIVAGGCNFPNKPASEGGEKVFYSDIYFLNINDKKQEWKKGGTLPQPTAYGSYVVTGNGVVCLGGQTTKGTSNDVLLLSFDDKEQIVKAKKLPSLPIGIFNADATIINHTIYITGGSSEGKNNILYALNLNDEERGWLNIETNLKGERQQPVLFSQNGDLFLGGGYDEMNAKAYSDILKFDFSSREWKHYTDIQLDGDTRTFVGTACANTSSKTLFVGGVDYQLFSSALERIQRKQKAIKEDNQELVEELNQAGAHYMSQEPSWYKFSTNLISFDAQTKKWQSLANFSQLARAGAGIAIDNKDVYIICGELKPGVRTAEVSKITLR